MINSIKRASMVCERIYNMPMTAETLHRLKISPALRSTAVMMLALAISALSGCVTVGPDYTPPEMNVPGQWSAELTGGVIPERRGSKELAQWWSTLNDPLLTGLIEEAITANHDLRNARARVREARARRNISRTGLFPSVDASGSFSKRRGSEDTGSGAESELYRAGFDAGWELDLFGGTRRTVEAAEADLDASRENLRDVLVTLISEVAMNYIELQSARSRLSIAGANLAAQAETFSITQWRFKAGLTTELDVEQARYSLGQTRAQLPALEVSAQQAENRITVLLGKHPGSLKDRLADHSPVPVPPPDIAVGIPADVIRLRPDVRRAERWLAAETARVGVAAADLYPKFRLSGSIGVEALTFDNLFLYSSRTYGISPGFSWNIFDAGKIRQNIEVKNALQEQSLIQYEQAVLAALADVENALVAFTRERVRMESLREAAQAAQRASDLAQSQYLSGLIDFQAVLIAQRASLSLQDQVASSEADVISNLISLYKALGGGWTMIAETEEQQFFIKGEDNETTQ
jgi:NodT family efflux transporter outer membrane factor (OMF) lipoprotein